MALADMVPAVKASFPPTWLGWQYCMISLGPPLLRRWDSRGSRFAQHGQIGPDAVIFLAAGQRQAKAGITSSKISSAPYWSQISRKALFQSGWARKVPACPPVGSTSIAQSRPCAARRCGLVRQNHFA